MTTNGTPGRAVRVFDRTLRPVIATARDGLDHGLERRFGIESIGEVELDTLGLDTDGRLDYKPTPWMALPRVLRPGSVGPDDVFADFGAGKGRAVVLAARYPFKRVIGVELSTQLSAIARANVERSRHRLRCPDVEIVASDVLAYEIPDDLTVAFLNNPFGGEVFAGFLDRLLASADRRPRRLRVIYRNPTEHARLKGSGRVQLVRRVRGWRPTPEWSASNAINVYEVRGGNR